MIEVVGKQKFFNGYLLDKNDELAIYNFKMRKIKQGFNPTDEEIDYFFLKRLERKNNKLHGHILNSIKEIDSENNYFSICKTLKINYNRLMYLSTKGYNKRKIIIYTWFYYDKVNEKNEKMLSLKTLKIIESEQFLKTSSRIIDFIVSHKIGKTDAFNRIFELESTYYIKVIKRKLSKLHISYTKSLCDDILSECYVYLHSIIDKVVLVEDSQVKKYISKFMVNNIGNYIYKNYYKKDMSLDYHLDSHADVDYRQNPLLFLINNQEREILFKALSLLEEEDLSFVYDLYFKSASPSISNLLSEELNGYDIHRSIGKFQETFLSLYEGKPISTN